MRNAGSASLTLLPDERHPAWPDLRDLAFALATEAAALTGRPAPGTAAAVGDLVRGMNFPTTERVWRLAKELAARGDAADPIVQAAMDQCWDLLGFTGRTCH